MPDPEGAQHVEKALLVGGPNTVCDDHLDVVPPMRAVDECIFVVDRLATCPLDDQETGATGNGASVVVEGVWSLPSDLAVADRREIRSRAVDRDAHLTRRGRE